MEAWLIYKVVIIFAVQQSDSVICIHYCILTGTELTAGSLGLVCHCVFKAKKVKEGAQSFGLDILRASYV